MGWGWCQQRHIAMRWAGLVSSVACTLALDRAASQCQMHTDCQALGAGLSCADGVCVRLNIDEVPSDDGPCSVHSDCAGSYGQSICIDEECRPLDNSSARCVSRGWGTTSLADSADVLVIGMLVPEEELGESRRVTGAVATAVHELEDARINSPASALPAVVAVACSESTPEAVRHLVDTLKARIIVGPTRAMNLEATLRSTGDSAILFSPYADSPDLPLLLEGTNGWLVSCKPNRSAVRSYFLDAIAEARSLVAALGAPGMEPIEPVLAVSRDPPTTAFSAQFDDPELREAGVRRVSYTADSNGSGLVGILNAVTPRPNFVIAASSEDDWATNIAAYDSATYLTEGVYPYYFLADKSSDVLSRTNAAGDTGPSSSRPSMRLIGLDYHRDDQVARTYSDFAASFVRAYGFPPAGLEYAYDCAYLGVLSAVAASKRRGVLASEVSAIEVLLALDALRGGGPQLSLRASNIDEISLLLAASRGETGTVNLIGSSGQLDIEQSVDTTNGLPSSRLFSVAAPDGELYCVSAPDGRYCNTGVVFPATGGDPIRSGAGCTCFASTE